jgi:Na+-driven multidrug efflux pump
MIVLSFSTLQAILAGSFAEKDYKRTTAAATRTLQFGFILGLGLSLIVGFGLYFGAGIFSKNAQVIHFIRVAVPVSFANWSIPCTHLFVHR